MSKPSTKNPLLFIAVIVVTVLSFLCVQYVFLADDHLSDDEFETLLIGLAVGAVIMVISTFVFLQTSDRKPSYGPDVKKQLAGLGYEYISERNMTSIESMLYTERLNNYLVLNRIARGSMEEWHRVYHIRTEAQDEFELITEVYMHSKDNYELNILKANRVE